jgi:hypothetical protein
MTLSYHPLPPKLREATGDGKLSVDVRNLTGIPGNTVLGD